jgi:hypothetical protein
MYYTKAPFVIDTAQGGVTMETYFVGTTRTWAGGDDDTWLLMTQEDVLFVVPGASEDLISLGKLTKINYTGVMHADMLKLLYADTSRKDKVALTVSVVNNVCPIKVRNAERTDAEIMQVTHKLQAHAKVTDQARTAFPRLVTGKHIGEENCRWDRVKPTSTTASSGTRLVGQDDLVCLTSRRERVHRA